MYAIINELPLLQWYVFFIFLLNHHFIGSEFSTRASLLSSIRDIVVLFIIRMGYANAINQSIIIIITIIITIAIIAR